MRRHLLSQPLACMKQPIAFWIRTSNRGRSSNHVQQVQLSAERHRQIARPAHGGATEHAEVGRHQDTLDAEHDWSRARCLRRARAKNQCSNRAARNLLVESLEIPNLS